MKTNLYIPREYRVHCENKCFVQFEVVQEQSDLFIIAKTDLYNKAAEVLRQLRQEIKSYIALDERFLTSLSPVKVLKCAPEIIKDMAFAGERMNVGPMAAVAGAISEYVARSLSQFSEQVIVENGGDNFIIDREPFTVGIYAGDSPLSMKIGIEIEPQSDGIAVCTSSGTVGHSLSFGRADAVTVIAKSGSLADAGATAICNMVKTEDDIKKALDYAHNIKKILGLIIIVNDKIGAIGSIVKLKPIAD